MTCPAIEALVVLCGHELRVEVIRLIKKTQLLKGPVTAISGHFCGVVFPF